MPRDSDAVSFTIETQLPDLIVQGANLPTTATELRDVLAASDLAFDRGGVAVVLRHPAEGGPPKAHRLTNNGVVTLAHQLCRPVKVNAEGHHIGVTLPDRVASMYLELPNWGLRPLAGITGAPLLQDDGSITTGDGYDARRHVWCANVPHVDVPVYPTQAEAEAALKLVRKVFRTFPFQDSPFLQSEGLTVVDTTKRAMLAESSFLAGLMTAVCRPSLDLAPGLLVSAPELTGSGAGKGLLVRATCAIAYGFAPSPFTAGHDKAEMDKRLVAELIEAGPVTFLDNVNSAVLRSDTLANVMTERPARVRVMGLSQMVPLNCAGLIAVTGNGLSVSEDLARRFLSIKLEPQCEDAESRPFSGSLIRDLNTRRGELLCALLTIWRWGRQNKLSTGLPFASFETWACWCRDPLVALGCADPIERVRQAKQADPKRRAMAELFERWSKIHDAAPMTVAALDPAVVALLDPQDRGRQFRAARLLSMTGMRIDGRLMHRQEPAGKWGAATYAVISAAPESPVVPPTSAEAIPPMHPMPPPTEGTGNWRSEL